MENSIKNTKITTLILGSILIAGTCVFGTLFLINKSDFSLFPRMKDNLTITASTHTATRSQRRKTPILSYYQPVKVSFENKGSDIIKIESEDISLPFHSFKNVSNRLASIRRSEALKSILFGAVIVAFAVGIATIANNHSGSNNHNSHYVGPYYSPYCSSSYFCSTNKTYVTVINYNGESERKEVALLEPGQTITIPPYSTVTRILACPRKKFTSNITIEKNTKNTLFDIEIKEEK
jgi:hypothetical protein